MRLSLTDWWNDVAAILRANASILIAVAGAFIFLPSLAGSMVAVPFVSPGEGASADEMLAAYTSFFSDNWLLQLALLLITTLGQLILYVVLLDDSRPPVGKAFAIAAPMLPLFFLTSVLVRLILAGGFILFVVPALYLFGRILLSGAAFVAERRTNPIQAISRSFALTRGNGWRNFLFVFLIFMVALVIQLAVSGTLGTVLRLVAGGGGQFSLGQLLLAALASLFESAYFLLGVAISVALYRRLAVGAASAAT